MTFFPEIRFGDSTNIDAFGRLRTSEPTNLWTSEFQYNLHPLYFDEVTATNGTVTHLPNESAASLAVSTDSGSKALMQTFEYFRYQPGKSQSVAMTFVADSQQANTLMEIGYGDDDNGFFLQIRDASTIQFVRRTKTSGSVVDNTVAQASWNKDVFDGTGPSGLTLDLTKGQILQIDFQWLSFGRIRMCFEIGGVIHQAHEFLVANILDVGATTTGSLPVRWLIENTAAASAIKTLTAICSTVYSEGGIDEELGHTFTGGNGATKRTSIGTTGVPICSIRPATTLNSIATRIKWALESIEIFADDSMFWELVYAPSSITGATFAVGAVAHSATEVDIAGTAITGGVVIAGGYVAANNKGGIAGLQIRTKFPFALDSAGSNQSRSLSIVVTTLGGTNKTAAGQFNWVEVR